MIDHAIKLFGTDEPVPEQRRLIAGPVTATLENGQRCWIRLGDAGMIRAIAFLIRGRDWSTRPPDISNLAVEDKDGGFGRDPDSGDRGQPFAGQSLTLRPLAVARQSFGG